jgi:hypothetical protein
MEIETAGSFKTLIPMYQTTRHHITEASNLQDFTEHVRFILYLSYEILPTEMLEVNSKL